MKGSGLGLSISRRIATLLGGRLWVESELGHGATFHLELPKRFLPVTLGEAPRDGRPAALVVARSREELARYERMARKAGFVALPAQDTPFARQLVESRRPSVVVVDAELSDGAAWRLIEELSAAAELPLFAVSSASARERAALVRVRFFDRSDEHGLLDGLSSVLARPKSEARPKILVIDDDESHRYLVRRLLQLLHLEVVEAAGGREGLKLALTQSPSVILLDLGMPDLDGFSVLEALKSNSETAHLPVIVHTGIQLSSFDRARLKPAAFILAKESKSQEAQLRTFEDALIELGVLKPLARESTA